MELELLLPLLGGVFIIAVLYSAVGHAGASGYIAVMSLLSLAPAVIKPSALALNILVAAIGTVQFMRAGHFSWRLFWPFAILAVPFAFVGGYVALPDYGFKFLVGLVLLFSAVRLLIDSKGEIAATIPSLPAALAAGAVIGLLSGLTGTAGRHFSHTATVVHGLDNTQNRRSSFCAIHTAQFCPPVYWAHCRARLSFRRFYCRCCWQQAWAAWWVHTLVAEG